jgi:hypothetical protein
MQKINGLLRVQHNTGSHIAQARRMSAYFLLVFFGFGGSALAVPECHRTDFGQSYAQSYPKTWRGVRFNPLVGSGWLRFRRVDCRDVDSSNHDGRHFLFVCSRFAPQRLGVEKNARGRSIDKSGPAFRIKSPDAHAGLRSVYGLHVHDLRLD